MGEMTAFPWYDSQWHSAYARVHNWLQAQHAERLSEFVDMLAPLRTRPDFQILTGGDFLTAKQLAAARDVIANLPPQQLIGDEQEQFGRDLFRHHPVFNRMQWEVQGLVGDLVREEVDVSYNFLSLYRNMGQCPLHLDSPESKWTLDLCLDQSRDWPIYFSEVVDWPLHFQDFAVGWEERVRSSLHFTEHTLRPGQGLIFSGSSQWHYRNAITKQSGQRDFCSLIFFHFMPKGFLLYRYAKIWALHMELPEIEAVAAGNWAEP